MKSHEVHSEAYLPKEPHAVHLSRQLIHQTLAAVAQETSGVLRRQRIERPAHSPPRALSTDMKSASAPFKAPERSLEKRSRCRRSSPIQEPLLDARLVDGQPPRPQPGELPLVFVHAHHPVPEVSKAGRRNRPHVPAPHDPYPETLAHHNLSTPYARDVKLFLALLEGCA